MTTVTFRIEFTEDTTQQAEVAATWWRENRPAAPHLFDDELVGDLVRPFTPSGSEREEVVLRFRDIILGSDADDPRG